MCGRYALHANPEVISLLFGLDAVPAFPPRYNISPTMPVLHIRVGGAAIARWGLIPRWAKDPARSPKMHNARAETVASKPSFREAYRKRRCLIPANGFYEWRDEGGRRQPYYVRPANDPLFAFAGLWEAWGEIETCAIITTEANAEMAAIHDRMPVILAPADHARWLAGEEGLLAPCPAGRIAIDRVSRAVNDGRAESPDLIRPEPA